MATSGRKGSNPFKRRKMEQGSTARRANPSGQRRKRVPEVNREDAPRSRYRLLWW